MKRELTCICCPLGCVMEVEFDGKNVTSVIGNTCKRGEEYAKSECINPVRMVTSTIKNDCGKPVPVKTDRPIPKDKIFECMDIINRSTVKTPVKIGDVLIKDIFGCNIVATADSL